MTTTIKTERVSSASYAASVTLGPEDDQTFQTNLPDGSEVARSLLYSYPAEYQFRPPNVELLQAIARDTGGVFAPSPEQIFEDDGVRTVRPLALWPFLAALALALYLLDLLLRRIRLFEASSDLTPPFQF
jgi:hypothetical protein